MTEKRKKNGQFAKGSQPSEKCKEAVRKATIGKKHAAKLSTLELKREAYRQYLHHISLGKSKKSWCFEHPELTLIWETLEKYIKNEPEIFDPLQMKIAYTKGYKRWEQVCEDSAEGQNQKANTASLQMIMRNKFGWDKDNNETKNASLPLVLQLSEQWGRKNDD